ncbi:MAG: cation diffusion facilitator family transporter [Burkholderiaceae bacterium]
MSSSSNDSGGSVVAIFWALGANAGIAIAKFAAAVYTGSGAMLAEAIHSLADCANQLLLLVGIRQAKDGITDIHPLGTGRVVYFYAMMVALMLFLLGGAFSVYEGISRMRHPEAVHNPVVALLVLGVSIVLESLSLRGALKEIRKTQGDRSFWQWFRETRQSELLVVAGEDIAALAGLAFAFVAVLASYATGNPLFDALGSVAVGILLMVVAVLVMREVKSMIVGESAEPQVRRDIRRHIEERPEVISVISIITLQWGDAIVVAVQADMATQPSATALVDAINVVEASIQARWPAVKWVFFEPDHPKREASGATPAVAA